MNSFWTTLIEINLILSIVYLGYGIFLKNLTFFRWTRAYLLGGMLLGLVYPFLKIQQVVYTPAEGVNIVIPDISQVSRAQSFDYNQWAVYIVSAIFLLLALRFLTRFFSLGKIHFASHNAEFNGRTFRNTRRQINPFSFWKWIYIHRDSHSDHEMRQIVTHEHIHTRERHTFDVLVTEVCSIICWYNPVVRLLSKAVKDNLEFLTDAEVLCSGIDRISYQHSLVGISLNKFPQPRHGNQFAFKTLKKRIRMMNKEQSPKFRLASYLLLTPLVLGSAALLTFSCQKEAVDTIAKARKSEGIVIEAPVEQAKAPAKTTGTLETVNVFEAKAHTPEEDFKAGKSEGLIIELPGNQPGATANVRGAEPLKDVLIVLDGVTVESDLSKLNPNSIESITVLKDAASRALYGEKAKNGVILITTKTGKAGSRQ